MAVRKFKPTTPGQRHKIIGTFEEITASVPEKSLVFKREGRPSEHETLTSRLIDRPIRPLFPDGFYNEVQVICTVVSADPEVDPDIPAMLGASAALQISGIPFKGPIAGCRVGYINGQYVCNPHVSQMADSKLDLVVAGTSRAVLMVCLERHFS